MSKSTVDNIKHVVVLMFENRSFDHILGAMPGVNGVLDAAGNVKPELCNYLDPTAEPSADSRQAPFAITPGDSENAYITNLPGGMFNHNQDAVFIDLDGPGARGVLHGMPLDSPWPVYPATNSGFVYVNNHKSKDVAGYPSKYSIMSYFDWGSMQVLHRLADEYVVCDNWFCDMPGHTGPNRAFMHCATAGGLSLQAEGDSDAANEPHNPDGVMVEQNGNNTIFQRLEEYGCTWKMYVPDGGWHLDTYFLNHTMMLDRNYGPDRQTNCTNVPLSQFCTDVAAGNLPTYSFIMCFNDPSKPVGATDPDYVNFKSTNMHPYGAVESGENLLAGVYNTLRNSEHWYDTLLVVNFDENGGAYDHVRPPRAVPPNPENQKETVTIKGKEYEFDFSILGFRIPAILISPWLKKGVESQQLQNTSILRFLQDRFCVNGPIGEPIQLPPPYLTLRWSGNCGQNRVLSFECHERQLPT